jgi:hypothetical protein
MRLILSLGMDWSDRPYFASLKWTIAPVPRPFIMKRIVVVFLPVLRVMNYVIATLPDRDQAETAYSALEKEGLPMDTVSILGKGYKTIDELSAIDPTRQARKQAQWMSYWLIPFGFVAGFAFNLSTNFDLFPWAGGIGNHLFGGLFGAIAGAMGSFFVGGGSSIMMGNNNGFPYRKLLKAGKYLVVVSGAPNLTNQASRILKQLKPESIQGFIDPTKA